MHTLERITIASTVFLLVSFLLFGPVEWLLAARKRPQFAPAGDWLHFWGTTMIVPATALTLMAFIGGTIRETLPAWFRDGMSALPLWMQLILVVALAGDVELLGAPACACRAVPLALPQGASQHRAHDMGFPRCGSIPSTRFGSWRRPTCPRLRWAWTCDRSLRSSSSSGSTPCSSIPISISATAGSITFWPPRVFTTGITIPARRAATGTSPGCSPSSTERFRNLPTHFARAGIFRPGRTRPARLLAADHGAVSAEHSHRETLTRPSLNTATVIDRRYIMGRRYATAKFALQILLSYGALAPKNSVGQRAELTSMYGVPFSSGLTPSIR